MRPKIFIARKIPREAEEYLEKYCECRRWAREAPINRQQLLGLLEDAEGLLVSGSMIDEELLGFAPKLRAVSNMSVGYNNFDIHAMKARNVIGTHTPHVLDETVGDLILGLMLATSRRISELDKFVKNGRWKTDQDSSLFGIDVHHATLGIIGMGRIGEAVARRAKLGFNMNVVYFNRSRRFEIEEKLQLEYCPMETLLQISDFIVVMTPLTPLTKHLIDYNEFALMKENAIFINASRGEVVNEKAMIEALHNKKISGAGLDVFEIEPVEPDNPLLRMDNVVTLPHIGSATQKTRLEMGILAAKNLVDVLYGHSRKNIVPGF